MTMTYKLTLDCPKSSHHSKVIAYLLLSFKIKDCIICLSFKWIILRLYQFVHIRCCTNVSFFGHVVKVTSLVKTCDGSDVNPFHHLIVAFFHSAREYFVNMWPL